MYYNIKIKQNKMSFNMDNIIIWENRMRNPEPLTQNEKNLINECSYLSRIRLFSENTEFNEYHNKVIHRSFTWNCNKNCICLKPYIL